MGFIKVANETMCRPIRALTQMKGYEWLRTHSHALEGQEDSMLVPLLAPWA